jgi:hypothetical protein
MIRLKLGHRLAGFGLALPLNIRNVDFHKHHIQPVKHHNRVVAHSNRSGSPIPASIHPFSSL